MGAALSLGSRGVAGHRRRPPGRGGGPGMTATAERAVRIVLALLAISALVVGLWAQFAPRSFYDSFPGGGRHWVSVDGPYNEHLVRDVGGLNLALAVITIAAQVWLGPRLVSTAAVAWLVYSVPHFLYHLN